MMNLIYWMIFGLVAGAIAKRLMPGKDPGGWMMTMILGVGGSFLGGFIGRQLLGIQAGTNEFNLLNMAVAIMGAILLLGIYRFVRK